MGSPGLNYFYSFQIYCDTILTMTLKEAIDMAKKNKVALGHFNVASLEMIWAVFRAANEIKVPVIIGLSEGERNFIGIKQSIDIIKSIKEQYNYPIFLNADHSYSFEKVKEAIDLGFDSAIIDAAKLNFEENVALSKKCVEYRNKIGSQTLIEGELGYIGSSSKVLDRIVDGAKVKEVDLVTAKQAEMYVKETGVDLFAPAVGNIHGMLRNAPNPKLSINRITEIGEACGVPLVLHGGSGVTNSDFTEAIKSGISIIHVSTEIRVAYRKSIMKSLTENPDEVAPYKYMKEPIQAVAKVVGEKLKLFNHLS